MRVFFAMMTSSVLCPSRSIITSMMYDIEGEEIEFPVFNNAGWQGLQREEARREKVEVMWETSSADVVRWVGSDTNRMELCCAESGDWYFICKQDEKFFGVSVIGCHPEVHCNDFVFCNSDGSTDYSVDISEYIDPVDSVASMKEIAMDFIHDQTH